MSTRVVVATDGTGPSRAAAAWATEHATSMGLTLVKIQVAEDADHDAHEADGQEHTALTRRNGDTVSVLAEFVNADDLLVLGTGKTGFVHSRVYGSRGIQIAVVVPCDTVVVPDVDLHFRFGVVAGVDDDDTALLIASTAAREADTRAEPLLICHSTHTASRRERHSPSRTVADRAAATVRRIRPTLSVRVRTTNRPAAAALLDASMNAALLVIGARAATPGHPFGTVFHDVLVNINAPVFIVRHGA